MSEQENPLSNPFPHAFYHDEEGAPENIWEPMFTQNTVNGWAHDSWEQCRKAHIDAGYLSPEEHAKKLAEELKKFWPEHPDETLPLIGRERAESGVGTHWCNGTEFEDWEKEDLIRMFIFGAEVQRDRDLSHVLLLLAEAVKAEKLKLRQWLRTGCEHTNDPDRGSSPHTIMICQECHRIAYSYGWQELEQRP